MTFPGTGRRHAALLALVMLAPGPVVGSELRAADGGVLTGIWRGTLGEREVVVCFDGPDRDGAFYDLRHPQRVALHPQPDGTWQAVGGDAEPHDPAVEEEDCEGPCEGVPEDPGTGIWHLEAPALTPEAEQITGHWTAAETGQALPIRLTRGYLIGDPGAENAPTGPPCDNLAFTAPFSKSIRVVTGEPRTFAGHRYRTRTLTIGDGLEISGIELLEPGPHAASISRKLRGLPESDAESALELFDCRQRLWADMHVRGEIEFWSERWLGTAEASSVDCGGSHPNEGRTHHTWDLATGEDVDFWDWIADRPRLLRLVLARALSSPDLLAEAARKDPNGDDEGCAATLQEGWVPWQSPYLGLHGMVFATELPHVVQACDQKVEIPYAELLPLASDKGRREILDILATLPMLPPTAPIRSPAGTLP
jgi:hypothetical protein